jgi:hypothetical protein
MNSIQSFPLFRREHAFLKKQSICNPEKYILLLGEIKQICPFRVIETVLLRVSAKHLQQRPHSRSHADAHSLAAVANREPATRTASQFDIFTRDSGRRFTFNLYRAFQG